jgi:hypothetical protein
MVWPIKEKGTPTLGENLRAQAGASQTTGSFACQRSKQQAACQTEIRLTRPRPLGRINNKSFMLVIVSVANLKSGLQVSVERPQHTAKATRTYNSVNEAKNALLNLGIAEDVLNASLELLPKLGTGQPLKFPPLNVPHHDLVAEGFKLGMG